MRRNRASFENLLQQRPLPVDPVMSFAFVG